MKKEEAWTKAIELIESKVGAQTFDLWFRPVKIVDLRDDTVVLEVPNKFFKEWIEDHYPDVIPGVMKEIVQRPVSVTYTISERHNDPALKKIESSQENRRARLAKRGIFLNPKFTFETFVVGACNQLAHAASMAVADAPGKAYNPLFLSLIHI